MDKWRIRNTNVTIVVYMAILVFHSYKETYRQYRLQNNYDKYLWNKLRMSTKSRKLRDNLFLEQKYLKIE